MENIDLLKSYSSIIFLIIDRVMMPPLKGDLLNIEHGPPVCSLISSENLNALTDIVHWIMFEVQTKDDDSYLSDCCVKRAGLGQNISWLLDWTLYDLIDFVLYFSFISLRKKWSQWRFSNNFGIWNSQILWDMIILVLSNTPYH